MEMEAERRAVADDAAELASRTPGRTGNLSVRRGDRIAIKPTGVPYDEIDPGDVSVLGLDGTHLDGLDPSSEAPMHLAVYREFDAGAIVHTHSPWSTALAVLNRPVPPVHYVLAAAGGEVPVAEYATYGTEELAANAVEAMARADTSACLLANHGLLVADEDLDDAIETADHVEFTARVYCAAATVGDPVSLPAEEIERVARKLEGYGQGQ